MGFIVLSIISGGWKINRAGNQEDAFIGQKSDVTIEVKRTGPLPPAGNVKPNLKVIPSLFTQQKPRLVASLKTKVNVQALKTSPKASKVYFPPHFYDKNLLQNYRIKYFKFICMEFAIKLPIFMRNTKRGVEFPKPWSIQKLLCDFTCFDSPES